ncbi:hypothetical protein BO79DRAFT_45179 [Aspergillus costaricaensis CBS 115574]|uniref:Uncharacterized protein n=1 Tax=Aspergillus costaricaensis CBS 115574 TaxID=1448317 RepID=A0ACD1IRT0_9EURO|nr:hypothetical protein BO79DRAFT_45179 [Aspergillus costaricaensis CBS 115574]RAK93320.1 hypothetical protein BO79DRAFT_45179 [Aspergillus costaricaensis CBS 115574]
MEKIHSQRHLHTRKERSGHEIPYFVMYLIHPPSIHRDPITSLSTTSSRVYIHLLFTRIPTTPPISNPSKPNSYYTTPHIITSSKLRFHPNSQAKYHPTKQARYNPQVHPSAKSSICQECVFPLTN